MIVNDEIVEVPDPLVATLKSIQIAVPTVRPVAYPWSEKGRLSFAVPCIHLTGFPDVVPVRADPLTGAVPAPYLICTEPPPLLLLLTKVPVTENLTLPVTLGVRDAAVPIMTPVAEVVPAGSAGRV